MKFREVAQGIEFEINEAPLVASPGQQAAQIAKGAAAQIAIDAIPYGSLLQNLFKSVHGFADIAKNPKTQLDAILRAMSVNDGQRQAGLSKIDIDDNLYAMLSEPAKSSIADRILKYLRTTRLASIDEIPDSLGNMVAKQYIAGIVSKVR